jgi:5'-nucleotidase
MSERPRILLTNDDGAHAPGLRAAYDALSTFADVTVVAPSSQRSGASHCITLDTPLRAYPLKDLPGFRVDFSPVDCVKLALSHLLDAPPQLVVSGINRGSNGGQLGHYSGTVAAAKEAALAGVPSVAFSLCQWREPDFTAAAKAAALIVQRVLAEGLPTGVVLNVNVPKGAWSELKGFRWCRQSQQALDDHYDRREDPRGKPYYWLSGTGALTGRDSDDDLMLLEKGFVTLTPLTLDWTHEEMFGAGGAEYLKGLDDQLPTSSS